VCHKFIVYKLVVRKCQTKINTLISIPVQKRKPEIELDGFYSQEGHFEMILTNIIHSNPMTS